MPWLQFASRAFALLQQSAGRRSLWQTAMSLSYCSVHSGLLLHRYGSPLAPEGGGGAPDRRYSDFCGPESMPANHPAAANPPSGPGSRVPPAPKDGSGGTGGDGGSEMSGGGGGGSPPWHVVQTPLLASCTFRWRGGAAAPDASSGNCAEPSPRPAMYARYPPPNKPRRLEGGGGSAPGSCGAAPRNPCINASRRDDGIAPPPLEPVKLIGWFAPNSGKTLVRVRRGATARPGSHRSGRARATAGRRSRSGPFRWRTRRRLRGS